MGATQKFEMATQSKYFLKNLSILYPVVKAFLNGSTKTKMNASKF
jgi:hypothetical protein